MAFKSTHQIPLLKDQEFETHYFEHTPVRVSAKSFNGHFGIYDRSTLRRNISAHRLDSYLIFLAVSGEGIHTSGTNEHYIRNNMLGFIGPNVVSSWRSKDEGHQGYICVFSEPFFLLNRVDKTYLSSLPFFKLGGNSILVLNDREAQEFQNLFRMVEMEFNKNSSRDILQGFLQVLLGKSMSIYATLEKDGISNHPPSGLRIVQAFTEAFMNDFNSIRNGKEIKLKKIADYAYQLGVSQNHLNDTIKSVTGRSAGQLMKVQLARQAAVCLKHSTKSISEISYLLGFEDPSYFARFVKKQTGKLPSDHRVTPVKSAMDSV